MKQSLRALLDCWILALFCTALVIQANAQSETVYVSTGAGQQILAFNAITGTVNGVCNLAATPEDVVVGPDGQLYVANATGNQILRVSTPIPAPVSPATSCGAAVVYDQSVTPNSCTNAAGQANQPCPTGPEGPSFLRINTLDLYFNTHGASPTGVWKITGLANAANAGCSTKATSCPSPTQVASSASSGEGLDFDTFGKLLAVDQTDGTVNRDTVSCLNGTSNVGCFTSFIPSLSSPVGVAVNTCGDILVASGKNVNRYDGGTGTLIDSLKFTGNNIPRFLEVDAGNRLFLVTAADETGTGGTFWRFDPPAGSALSAPCPALKNFTAGLNISIKTSLAAGIATSHGLGLGVSASNATITAPSFTAANPTHTYNFGQHSFRITCNTVLQPFKIAVTAVKSMPTDAPIPDVTFTSPFPQTLTAQCPTTISNPECLHYGGQHGYCTQYLESATDGTGNPISDANLVNFCSASPQFTFFATYSSAEFIQTPGGAHAVTDGAPNPVTETFNECQSQDFYPQQQTGDPMRMTGGNSKHVVYNSDLVFNGSITLNSPISSCTTTNAVTTCNPQFNVGQNINTKFTLLQATSPFGAITTATEQLSIARTSHTPKNGTLVTEFVPQTVLATKNSASLNFFVSNSSGQYSFNVDSSQFDQLPKGTTATYQFTIWGNGAPPFSFFTTGTF